MAKINQKQEQFMRIAMAIIKKHYPFYPQRLAIASKMYSDWLRNKQDDILNQLTKEEMIKLKRNINRRIKSK